jgi:hypothetical protein
MGVESFRADLFLDNNESVWPKLGLKGAKGWNIDHKIVLDADLLRPNSRHVGPELLEHGIAHARFGGDKGEDV